MHKANLSQRANGSWVTKHVTHKDDSDNDVNTLYYANPGVSKRKRITSILLKKLRNIIATRCPSLKDTLHINFQGSGIGLGNRDKPFARIKLGPNIKPEAFFIPDVISSLDFEFPTTEIKEEFQMASTKHPALNIFSDDLPWL